MCDCGARTCVEIMMCIVREKVLHACTRKELAHVQTD